MHLCCLVTTVQDHALNDVWLHFCIMGENGEGADFCMSLVVVYSVEFFLTYLSAVFTLYIVLCGTDDTF